MATHPLSLSLPLADPAHVAVEALALRLATGQTLARRDLLSEMTEAYGCTSADGRWSQRTAYDVLEAAQVLHLKGRHVPASSLDRLRYLIEMTLSLPTQSARSEEQVALQQFSTPAPIGFLAALAVGVQSNDTVLEPSAGTGLLAVHAAHAGAGLILNELDPWRAALLAHGLAASWAEQKGIQQLRFGLDRKLGDRAGFRRNEQMLSVKPRYVVAFQGNGVTERLVVEAKSRGIRVVDRRGPLGTPPSAERRS